MRIPSTIEQATEALTGIESLLTKKGWERAAIVAAFVRLGNKPGPQSSSNIRRTPGQFIALKITGLTTKDTVITYVQHWLDANDGVYPEPGTTVKLPEGDYPPGGPRGNTQGELIQSALRAGTLVDKLTSEQKQELVETIIRKDERAAYTAQNALRDIGEQKHAANVRSVGGEPDLPPDDLGIDRAGNEAARIILGIKALAADVRGLHRRSEPDQWEKYQPALTDATETLRLSIQGITVPDSLEGVELS